MPARTPQTSFRTCRKQFRSSLPAPGTIFLGTISRCTVPSMRRLKDMRTNTYGMDYLKPAVRTKCARRRGFQCTLQLYGQTTNQLPTITRLRSILPRKPSARSSLDAVPIIRVRRRVGKGKSCLEVIEETIVAKFTEVYHEVRRGVKNNVFRMDYKASDFFMERQTPVLR